MRNSAKWPKKLPKRYEAKPFLTSRDLADIAHVSRIAINRYWLRHFKTASKTGDRLHDPWIIPTQEVIDFINKISESTTHS